MVQTAAQSMEVATFKDDNPGLHIQPSYASMRCHLCRLQVAGLKEHLQQMQVEHQRSEEQRHLVVKSTAAVSCSLHMCLMHL